MDLYVHFSDRLLHLDLSVPPPSPNTVLNYPDSDYPRSMSVVKSQSKILMLSGFHGAPSFEDSTDVYEFDPTANSLTKTETSLKDPKPGSIVREIEGKIYALRTSPTTFPLEVSTFEVLDLSSVDSGWKVLPDHPCLTDPCEKHESVHSFVRQYFVFRHMLYLYTCDRELHYFDTSEGRWDQDTNMYKYVPSVSESLIPFDGKLVMGDVIISPEENRFDHLHDTGVRVDFYGFLYSRDGRLLVRQKLDNVFSGITTKKELYMTGLVLIPMDNRRYCALGTVWNHGVGCTPAEKLSLMIAISIFSVKKLPDAYAIQANPADTFVEEVEKRFFSVQIDNQYIFDGTGMDKLDLMGAFLA